MFKSILADGDVFILTDTDFVANIDCKELPVNSLRLKGGGLQN
jgi:hypothetical protein